MKLSDSPSKGTVLRKYRELDLSMSDFIIVFLFAVIVIKMIMHMRRRGK